MSETFKTAAQSNIFHFQFRLPTSRRTGAIGVKQLAASSAAGSPLPQPRTSSVSGGMSTPRERTTQKSLKMS